MRKEAVVLKQQPLFAVPVFVVCAEIQKNSGFLFSSVNICGILFRLENFYSILKGRKYFD